MCLLRGWCLYFYDDVAADDCVVIAKLFVRINAITVSGGCRQKMLVEFRALLVQIHVHLSALHANNSVHG